MCWLADREGEEGSEDRTSLRGVAVNPWPRWLSLQGGGGRGGSGGHFEVRLVQGHMMAGRGGGEVSNLVFVCKAFSPPPPSFLWEQSLRGRTMSKGSDLFYEPFKGDGGRSPLNSHKGKAREAAKSPWMPRHSRMFVYKMLLSRFPAINCSFPLLSDTWTMLCHCVLLHLKVLGETGGDDRGPSKELHQATRRTKTIHASAGGEMTDASTDKAFFLFSLQWWGRNMSVGCWFL